MLFYWLALALKKILWLFRLPNKCDVARINKNLPCPVCGATSGVLRCVMRQSAGPGQSNGQSTSKILCRHTCSECGARFYEAPIVELKPGFAEPALARSADEKFQDSLEMMNMVPSRETVKR